MSTNQIVEAVKVTTDLVENNIRELEYTQEMIDSIYSCFPLYFRILGWRLMRKRRKATKKSLRLLYGFLGNMNKLVTQSTDPMSFLSAQGYNSETMKRDLYVALTVIIEVYADLMQRGKIKKRLNLKEVSNG